MKIVTIAAILITTPASAQMSPAACNALSAAATNAAADMNGIISQLNGEAFRKAMPVMPEKAKVIAPDVDNARMAARMALQEYQHALQAFSAAMQNCGQ
ncbi:MAG: hypothetical protein EOS58_30680 [Mesorhizobium sp.]|nr:MAG: hypothetical protein EOS58_30680 [Mesorhizobium sp.]